MKRLGVAHILYNGKYFYLEKGDEIRENDLASESHDGGHGQDH